MGSPPDTTDETLRAYLIFTRCRLGLTQAEMASALGMGLRAYSDMETGKSRVRTIHVLAAERVTLRAAKFGKNPDLLAKSVEQELREVAAML